MHCKCHNKNPNSDGSYIDSLDWIKNKKATTNPINKKDNKCSQYIATIALNHEKIGKNPEKIIKINLL